MRKLTVLLMLGALCLACLICGQNNNTSTIEAQERGAEQPAAAPAPVAPTPVVPAVAAAAVAPASASDGPPIYQGFPQDTLAYFQGDLTHGLRSLIDVDGWQAAGAVGFSFADLSARLGEMKTAIAGNILRDAVKEAKRAALGITGLDDEHDPVWLLSIEHGSPASLLALLKAAGGMVSFTESAEFEGVKLYSLQVPLSWSLLSQRNMMRGGWGWGGIPKDAELFSDPITVAVWNGRYLIAGSRASDVKDAIEFYTYADDTEYSIAGSKSFKQAYDEGGASDFWVYWNIGATFGELSRVIAAIGAPAANLDSFSDAEQFRGLTFRADYDPVAGRTRARAKLMFLNPPSWMDIVRTPPVPTPLTQYCPPAPGGFFSCSMDKAGERLSRFAEFMRERSDALGSPELYAAFCRGQSEFTRGMDFSLQELLDQLGTEYAVFSLSPWDELGNQRSGEHVAIITRVTDEAKARAFISDKLAKSATLRDAFHFTAERAYMECQDGQRVPYTVYNAMSESAFAWTFLEGCAIFGTQSAVRAAIVAKTESKNLQSDARYTALRAELPQNCQITAYGDFGYLAANAKTIFGRSNANDNAMDEMGMFFGGMMVEEDEDQPAAPEDNGDFAVKAFTRCMADFRTGAALVLDDTGIEVSNVTFGLPTALKITDLAVLASGIANRRAALMQMRDKLAPAITDYLFANGDLPQTIEDFVAHGGERAAFRDPMLAGPAVSKPTDEQCFVWLGKHGDAALLPAIPLANTLKADDDGFYLLLMSDGSVHRVKEDGLNAAKQAEKDHKQAPYHSDTPQTLSEFGATLNEQLQPPGR